jgi:hypothetical protein
VAIIHQYLEAGAFDAEATHAMSTAFQAACAQLDDRKDGLNFRGIVAGRIIGAARTGERNPVALRDVALAGFAVAPGPGWSQL